MLETRKNILSGNFSEHLITPEEISGHYMFIGNYNIRHAAMECFAREKKQYLPCALKIIDIRRGLRHAPMLYKVQLPTKETLVIKRMLRASFLFDFDAISNDILKAIQIENAAVIDAYAYLKLPPRTSNHKPVVHQMRHSLFSKLWTPAP